eukprot:8106646-Pyramimonas_sp.AAC.1
MHTRGLRWCPGRICYPERGTGENGKKDGGGEAGRDTDDIFAGDARPAWPARRGRGSRAIHDAVPTPPEADSICALR